MVWLADPHTLFLKCLSLSIMTKKKPPHTANRRAREKARRRALILDTAMDIVRHQGLDNFQMEDLAYQTELAKGTLYRYFNSKDEVLTELIIKARLEIMERFKKATADKNNALEQLEAIHWCNYQFCQDDADLYELMFFYESTMTDEALLKRLEPSSKAIVVFLNDIIQGGIDDQSIRADLNPLEFSFTLYGTVMGMLKMLSVHAQMLQQQLQQTPEEVFAIFIARTLRGIAASPQSES